MKRRLWGIIGLAVLAVGLLGLVACGGEDKPTPTSAAVAAPTTAKAAATPTTAPSSTKLKEISRDRTLVSFLGGSEGRHVDFDLWNPYAIGANHQTGPNIMYEPLAFFSAFDDKMIPWLATSWAYANDNKELTIKLRSGVKWSDGEEFNADDVVYTLNTLKGLKEAVRWGKDVALVLDKAEKVDNLTVKLTLQRPDPRFFYFMAYKYDIGVYIVPEHIYKGQDWTTFKAFDVAKGWPVTTGPFKVVAGTPEQKVIDRRDSWWGVGQSDLGQFAKLPQVERVIYLPSTGDQTIAAQALIKNDVDYAAMTTPRTIKETLSQNAKLITHTGKESPWGYVDWWPVSLAFNDSGKFGPFDNPDVRWAISYYLDRKELSQKGYDGAAALNPLTMPQYPPLMKYFDEVKDLLAKYDTTEFSVAKGDERLKKAGFTKGSDGKWKDKSGNGIKCEIIGFSPWVDLGPLTAEQLRRQGIEASYIQPPDASSRMAEGNFECLMFGHGGSVSDPYFTMKLYQSASVNIPGGHQVNFYRWENAQWDKLTDQMAATGDEAEIKKLWRQAMEIWLPELPDVPVLEFYHRIVMNETHWTNWPQGGQTDGYVNEASWHLTWSLVLHNLKAVK